MIDDYDFIVKKIDNTEGFNKKNQKRQTKNKKKEKKKEEEAKDHFQELAETAERIHKILEEKKQPFRFCIYKEKNEVFIDFVLLDAKGKINKTIKKNITHNEFIEIIKHIETLDGFLVDFTV